MRVMQAVRLVRDESLPLSQLWLIATRAERVQVALILGLPRELPKPAATPVLAWNAMNTGQRRLVLRHAPPSIRRRLPADPAVGRRTVWRRHVVKVVSEAVPN